ncbi:protein fem-1 homolog CG6966 [Agrilus planipennis]|uniref:Protein fem-1 homolog CG6966 n=1 Tax=Agrilus planipennis TaxID=224129 RepID=A0A1W4WJ24_AGRPL|nr:protein fem-1 homolog CG6966 [Agrilus planipennis]
MNKKSVFYAARDGNLERLKFFLHNNKSKEEISMLVGTKTQGATPLVIACRNGHYEVVQFLIEHCNADIEQTGSVTFDGETIEGAPPLWCAAAAGYLELVQLLVKHGAKVNSTTRTNSTPLRAACFDGHVEIVKFLVASGADIEIANRHGHTCLMIACYKGHVHIAKYLLELNANVNRKSVKGNTALHDCAESGSLEILKLLLLHGGTMDVDSYGMTPLLAAAVVGHNQIVDYLITQTELVSRKEKIDALELLGATYVDKKRDMIGALGYWKQALNERYNGEGPDIPKTIAEPIQAYDYAVEIQNPEDLEELMTDPDEMKMQALVMRERILGPAHPDTSYYIRFRGAVYADAGKFNKCIELWNYALDMQQSMLERLNSMTQSSLFSFTELFSYMMGEEGKHTTRGQVVPPLALGDLLKVFRKALSEVEMGSEMLDKMPTVEKDLTHLTHVLVITLHLACLLVKMLEHPTAHELHRKIIYKAIYSLVKLKVTVKQGRTALHLACCKDASLVVRYPAYQFPSQQLAKVLLDVGADPNAADDEGNTPLHLAAENDPVPVELIKTLLDNGAHIDVVNKSGNTFTNLVHDKHIVNTAKYTKLSCIAAQIIQQFKIPYKGLVPDSLIHFIKCH